MKELAAQHPAYGHPMLHYLVRRENEAPINKKRTERIYREEKLSLRIKKKRKKLRHLRLALPQAEEADSVWSMDFVHDRAANNQQLKFLTMVDHCTREMPDLVVRSSFKGVDVAATLERLRMFGRKPQTLVVDNGPEFRSRSLQRWATLNGVRLHFIEPGKPQQNGYIESLNGKFRAECLDRNLFDNLDLARVLTQKWKTEYETYRPHSSLNGLTPSEYAKSKGSTKQVNSELKTG